MVVWAIVPVKRLRQGKRRLAPALGPRQREILTLSMLDRVLRALATSEEIDGKVVIAQDQAVLSLAAELGAAVLLDHGCDLNRALDQARQWCMEQGAKAVLVLPCDVPLVTAEDIDRIVRFSHEERVMVIAPSLRGDGTNALFLRPPGAIPYRYGRGSFATHRQLAMSRGLAVYIYHSDRLALDIDLPEDLSRLRSLWPKPEVASAGLAGIAGGEEAEMSGRSGIL
ncbi:MAG: 2-phospho-L-lactate guanylyltransferase [Chloroflexi bacterium]|nr:2-phospho-L-lactate guanylyltransferase [Chloroflexota bacterium]MCL5074399.1 2-phospho-L-lactate guanylyltransferase [Chloroflexota bacterium]